MVCLKRASVHVATAAALLASAWTFTACHKFDNCDVRGGPDGYVGSDQILGGGANLASPGTASVDWDP